MSRIGRAPIAIPAGVLVKIEKDKVYVTGPKGELCVEVRGGTMVKTEGGNINLTAKGSDKQSLAYWGLYRSLINNMVLGVTTGFRKDLEIVGVGYRAAKKGNNISLSVGYSHPIEFEAPLGITLNVEENTKISVTGADKSIVGLVASQIRAIRKPEPYKGKGIRYLGEQVRRKAGKAGAKATA